MGVGSWKNGSWELGSWENGRKGEWELGERELGGVSASLELKCKDNYDASGYENTTMELHIMPLVFNINLVLTLGSQESGYNWDIFNETYSWHLSDKMEFPLMTHTNGCFGHNPN